MSTPVQTTGERKGVWARLMHRLTTDADSLDAEALDQDESVKDRCKCCDVTAGTAVTVLGRLRSVVYTPSAHVPTLTAELFDGSGSMKLVWLGRRRIPGIEPGRTMVARGRVADRQGEPVIYNPWYELTAE